MTFAASATPPVAGTSTYKLSEAGSSTEVLAWIDGNAIKYYAQGYTDSGRKIPLNADSSWMFGNFYFLSIDVSGFDTSNVTDMTAMFAGCNDLTSIDLSSFDTSNVTDMRQMFSVEGGYSHLATIFASPSFVTTNVTQSTDMFRSCSSLKGGGSPQTAYNFSHIDKEYARIDGGSTSATPGYFTLKP